MLNVLPAVYKTLLNDTAVYNYDNLREIAVIHIKPITLYN